MNEIVVLSTADTFERAKKIASVLVGTGAAACVNIVPGIRSIYRWEGKVRDDSEFLLVIKSSTAQFEAVRSRIRQLHSYQVPEVIVLPIIAGDSDYLRWLNSELSCKPDPPDPSSALRIPSQE